MPRRAPWHSATPIAAIRIAATGIAVTGPSTTGLCPRHRIRSRSSRVRSGRPLVVPSPKVRAFDRVTPRGDTTAAAPAMATIRAQAAGAAAVRSRAQRRRRARPELWPDRQVTNSHGVGAASGQPGRCGTRSGGRARASGDGAGVTRWASPSSNRVEREEVPATARLAQGPPVRGSVVDVPICDRGQRVVAGRRARGRRQRHGHGMRARRRM
jgi:hypothetical protein